MTNRNLTRKINKALKESGLPMFQVGYTNSRDYGGVYGLFEITDKGRHLICSSPAAGELIDTLYTSRNPEIVRRAHIANEIYSKSF